MKAKYLKILSLLAFLIVAHGYNSCSVIKFSDYSFDLTGLDNFTIASQDTKFYTVIYPCASYACDSNPTSQKSFVQKGGSDCKPYSSTCLRI